MLEVRPLELDGVLEIRPRRFGDDRGFFSEVWREDRLSEIGIRARFVQDNHSYSKARGVLRGLHYQLPPAQQDKLVRAARGSIFDVAVDIRPGSPTFGRWAGVVLSAREWNQLFIPTGFAHGFVTLEDETEVLTRRAPFMRRNLSAQCGSTIRPSASTGPSTWNSSSFPKRIARRLS